MLEVVKAEPLHFLGLKVQPRHREVHRIIIEGLDRVPLDGAYTLLRDGEPVAIGGIHDGLGWALLGEDLRRGEMVVIHRVASKLLRGYNRPVVAEIDETHPEAVRWAKVLGMVKLMEGSRCAWYGFVTH